MAYNQLKEMVMNEDTFWLIVRNQRNWAEDYRRKIAFRDEVRKIINRKQRGKGGALLKENILKDLKSSLYPDEIQIIEHPEEMGVYSIRFLDEEHLLYKSNK